MKDKSLFARYRIHSPVANHFMGLSNFSTLGWRLGLQAITGMTSFTFILGIFYRPASLYHPQRRAILHLKGLQKRSKAKDKSAQKEKPPFFDFAVLKSRTVQILIIGSALSSFGINAPIMLLVTICYVYLNYIVYIFACRLHFEIRRV